MLKSNTLFDLAKMFFQIFYLHFYSQINHQSLNFINFYKII